MILFCGIVVAAFLVGLGYLNLWTASRAGTPSRLAAFGRILAIILFALAALALLAPAAALPMRLAGRAWGRKGLRGLGMFHKSRGCEVQGGHKWGKRGKHRDFGGIDIYSDDFEDRVWDIIDDYMDEEAEERGEERLPE